MEIDFVRLLNMRDQTQKDAIAWHETNMHFKTEREKPAYNAGYDKGFMDALSLLKTHYKIKFKQ